MDADTGFTKKVRKNASVIKDDIWASAELVFILFVLKLYVMLQSEIYNSAARPPTISTKSFPLTSVLVSLLLYKRRDGDKLHFRSLSSSLRAEDAEFTLLVDFDDSFYVEAISSAHSCTRPEFKHRTHTIKDNLTRYYSSRLKWHRELLCGLFIVEVIWMHRWLAFTMAEAGAEGLSHLHVCGHLKHHPIIKVPFTPQTSPPFFFPCDVETPTARTLPLSFILGQTLQRRWFVSLKAHVSITSKARETKVEAGSIRQTLSLVTAFSCISSRMKEGLFTLEYLIL